MTVTNKPAPLDQWEFCRKLEGGPDISFRIARPQSDASYEAKAGWTIPWGNSQVLGTVHFPAQVDPKSVKITVDSPDWVYVPTTWPTRKARSVDFVIMPKDAAQEDPLKFRTGKTGWVTLTMVAPNTAPATKKLFMFDHATPNSDVMTQCLTSIGIKESSH